MSSSEMSTEKERERETDPSPRGGPTRGGPPKKTFYLKPFRKQHEKMISRLQKM